MTHFRSLLRLALFASAAAPVFAASADELDGERLSDAKQRPILLAQLYDPGEEVYRDARLRVYIDPMGRRVTMDRRGRIISVEPAQADDRRVRRARNRDDNWTLDGPVDGGAPYDGFGNVPEDPNYYPAPPSTPGYGENRDGQIERSELPPPGDYPNTNGSDFGNSDSASLDDDSRTPAVEPSYPAERTIPNVDDMTPAVEMPKGEGAKAKIASYQILLGRAGASPGVIDGRSGSNVDKAAAAYGELTGKTVSPADEAALNAELDATGGPAFAEYMISDQDAAQPYVASIPDDYSEKAQLPSMAYTSVREMLAEKFHIDETYLQEINPGSDFRRPGEMIRVPNLAKPKRAKVARLIADKNRKQVRGYDESGRLVVAYPSTIGSSDNPSPSGIVQVERIAINPNYTYNPKINFKQGNNDKVLTIPPGPNGPVGTVWIALSKPTYGIHGTPEPSRIGKTSSHGCVRLTNWDAEELAKLVKPGVTVEFSE